jgi:hypothetical protein
MSGKRLSKEDRKAYNKSRKANKEARNIKRAA